MSKTNNTSKTDKKLRIGIIGTGGIAHAHVRQYIKMDDVEIVGGADIVPGKAQAFLDEFELTGAKAFTDHRELLKMDLDGVSVCTYNTTHAECAIDALNAGMHVLCEKPMSVMLDEAKRMNAAAKKNKKILTIGFQPRYDPNMIMLKDIVAAGTLGKVYYVQTGGGRRRGIPGRTFIEKKLAGVGALADIGCYALDMALNTIGYPKPLTVSACASDFFGKNPKYYDEAARFSVDDFSSAFIRLEGGIVLDFRMSWAIHMDTMGDTIFLGTDAGLKVTPGDVGTPWGGGWGPVGPVSLFHDVAGNLADTAIAINTKPFDVFYAKVRGFVEAIQTGGPAPIPGEQILYNQAIIDGIIRSSQAGREVSVDL